MASSAAPNVPNPNTPLAFLPPILAEQFQVSIYVVVGGFSVNTPLETLARRQLTIPTDAGICVGLDYVPAGRI